jgi:3-hydroxy acid dehydrogenase / malonic semialdehyde reductase
MKELKDKIVFITGASSGIGEATAKAFAQAGARLIIAARRKERLDNLVKQLHTQVHAIQLDVRDCSSVRKTIENLPSEWQEIEILVNNAGLSRGLDKLHQGKIEDWEEMIDTNVKGLLYVSRAVVPGMVSRKRGHIINIGSLAGHEVYPGGNVYCATKHAVDSITKGLRMDLYDTPIKVSTVDPGLVQTEFSIVRYHGDAEKGNKVYRGMKPLCGDDVAEAVLWVATRPDHVQVAEVLILPTAQASAMVTHRNE